MCRLYGFHANEETKVECSLVHAQNALMLQSRGDLLGRSHPHGWGVGYYTDAHPILVKKATAAYEDLHFSTTAERMYTRTVIAHVRYATVGSPNLLNSHPFSHGVWTFAHNGTVVGFDDLRGPLLREIELDLQNCIQGATDSETAFFWLLSRLIRAGFDTWKAADDMDLLTRVVAGAVSELAQRCEQIPSDKPPKLNFLLTDGESMVATRWNNSLHILERDGIRDCEICGIPHVHHDSHVEYRAVAVASEPVTHEVWHEVPEQSVVAIDSKLRVRTFPIGQRVNCPRCQ